MGYSPRVAESEATEATWHARTETFLVVTVEGWGWSAFDF